MKRLFDILISSIGLILFLPILAIIAVINVKSYGQVFSKEKRIGRNFRPFTQYKFRTTQAEERGEVARILSRDRVTGAPGVKSLFLTFTPLSSFKPIEFQEQFGSWNLT